MEFLKDLWDFMRVRKKLWLAPILLFLCCLVALLCWLRALLLRHSSIRCFDQAAELELNLMQRRF